MNKYYLISVTALAFLAFGADILTREITTPQTDKCIVIKGEITEQTLTSVEAQYRELVNKQDVCVELETPGGLLQPAIDIIVFLEKHTRTQTMIVENYAHSAGAFIMLSGTHLKISPKAMVVIHVPRIGHINDALLIDAQYNAVFNKIFLNQGKGNEVLRERVNDYLSGDDIVLTGADVVYNLHDFNYATLLKRKYTNLDNLKFKLFY